MTEILGWGEEAGLGAVVATMHGPLSLVLNTNLMPRSDMVTFHNLEMLMSPVQPLLEILGEAKEEAVVAQNERGHQRDLIMGREKGFLLIVIEKYFI